MTDRTVAVVCGGVGAARYLRGLVEVVPPRCVTAIVNVADDLTLHGLHISPDIDTVVYTLADAIDPDRGWGLRDESWRAMESLGRYGTGDWFSLGDRDLGTHLHRTQRLSEGAALSEVTAEIRTAWGVGVDVVPVTDDQLSTMVTLAEDGNEIPFQEYFVGRRHDVEVRSVRFAGVDSARPNERALRAIDGADVVVIAPSNPIVSIAPVLAVPGIRDRLRARSGPTVGVSPIVGGDALKGPAARLLAELGHERSAVGVARLFGDVLDGFVIDDRDAQLAPAVAASGTTPIVTDTIMSDVDRAAALARCSISTAGPLARRG